MFQQNRFSYDGPYASGPNNTENPDDPLEFMQRLAALVPRRRLHLIRFHGVLAPNAKLRRQITPSPTERASSYRGQCFTL